LTKYYVDKCVLGWILKCNVEILVLDIIDMVAVVGITMFVIAVYISINLHKHIHIFFTFVPCILLSKFFLLPTDAKENCF